MKTQENKEALQLSEPDKIVSEYLQALLSEVEEYQEPVKEVVAAPVIQTQEVVEIPESITAPKEEQAADATHQILENEGAEKKPQPVIPHWAKERFQCLLFDINGLHLAVALSELDSIAGKQETSTTHLLGQPEWHRGILEHRGYKVGVVDVARLVMPGKLSAVEEQTVTPNHVLIFGDGKWGLVCDKLLSPITIEPDDIHWSCRHENRAWMAGTLPDQLCIILDLDVLQAMINPIKAASVSENRHE